MSFTELEHSPGQIIRQLLIDLGQGSSGGTWPVHCSNEPESPDAVITILDQPGVKHGRFQVTGEFQEHHGVQIIIRHAKHNYAWQKTNNIARSVDENVLNKTVSLSAIIGTSTAIYTVSSVTRQPINSLGHDRISKRHTFNINCTCAIRQTQ